MWRLTDAQRELREHIRTVVLDEIRPATLDMGETDKYPQDIFDVLAARACCASASPTSTAAAPTRATCRSAPTSRSSRRSRPRSR